MNIYTILKQLKALKWRHKQLLQALDDIAKGMVPAGEMPSLEDIPKFHHEMWSWSQKRAREGILADENTQ